MSKFSKSIAPFVAMEITAAKNYRNRGDFAVEFSHLENAHVLGQESTYHHVKVHCLMLLWGLRQRRVGEIVGQLIRILGAATKTAIGFVPTGNTGGSNISPFKSIPIKPELSAIISRAKATQ
ncbi:DUF3703 domain-containing protein [Oceanicoccus sp. KOV_DT_Chl]|uniref:DUF3703 domain-containing protein n=1 Tax=Oceanicoccus sp. KOV_DT_Chl TaxID=1904639 RepID=UPI00190EE742|nr:DUF3703 domain-containing protein [Oceanicoccus sp. KOV_DT_Chl]